jgi:hypothetical protein
LIADPWFWALAIPAVALSGIRILLGVVALGVLARTLAPRSTSVRRPPTP